MSLVLLRLTAQCMQYTTLAGCFPTYREKSSKHFLYCFLFGTEKRRFPSRRLRLGLPPRASAIIGLPPPQAPGAARGRSPRRPPAASHHPTARSRSALVGAAAPQLRAAQAVAPALAQGPPGAAAPP